MFFSFSGFFKNILTRTNFLSRILRALKKRSLCCSRNRERKNKRLRRHLISWKVGDVWRPIQGGRSSNSESFSLLLETASCLLLKKTLQFKAIAKTENQHYPIKLNLSSVLHWQLLEAISGSNTTVNPKIVPQRCWGVLTQ